MLKGKILISASIFLLILGFSWFANEATKREYADPVDPADEMLIDIVQTRNDINQPAEMTFSNGKFKPREYVRVRSR
ncbi:hypothetical protein GJU40_15660 [Bacillus lacus]|uniref:Uncharacterized protein n=1 Tax=Metabacillus lacus TaxID=1983721 RepID=A0A7X2LZM1_9BACI|nr:hypothetical protein [Metabacillus lacus]MRX73581.1 hypothetical protein [Metabacillus lacus]